MSKIREQPIEEDDWDHLIVLDACRYDYFEKNYSAFLGGELEKVKSRASATPEWLTKTFDGFRYNIKYITANPFVNRRGLPINELTDNYDSDWYAGDKFTEIREAWIEEWHEKGTVHPEDLKEYAKENISEEDTQNIIHFIQPHRPFISYDGEDPHSWTSRERNLEDDEEEDQSTKFQFFKKTRPLWAPIFHNLPKKYKYKIRGLFGMESGYREFAAEVGEEKTKEYYTEDLRLALEQIAELTKDLDGKVVVTADHGESFGENYEWGHPVESKNPVLREVPWLEVEK